MENAILVSSVIIGFALMVGFAAFGSAIGDGIIGSKAVESIALEMERIGEGQRFVTKLLNDPGRPVPQGSVPSKVPERPVADRDV